MLRKQKCITGPKKEGWKIVILIIIIFSIMYALQSLLIEMSNIKGSWAKYRCNPLFTPFSKHFSSKTSEETFADCVADQQTGMMGDYTDGISHQQKVQLHISTNLANSVQNSKNVFDKLADSTSGAMGGMLGIFFNVLIAFQTIFIKLKDMIMKSVATSFVILNLLKTQTKMGESITSGPFMTIIGAICFHPKTTIITKNGEKLYMKDLNLGETLNNGSNVVAILKIKGNQENPYYKIYSHKLKDYIFVTGNHLIQDPTTLKFIPVSTYTNAIKTEEYTEEMSCLVTDDHLIPIGEFIFWDWED